MQFLMSIKKLKNMVNNKKIKYLTIQAKLDKICKLDRVD